MSRRNPHYNPRAPENFFNSPYSSGFSAFSIGNPKQQHNHPPDYGPHVFDPNMVSDFSSFPIGNPKQHHNYPLIFPKPKKEVFLKVEILLMVQ
jgi:hypothetical protein